MPARFLLQILRSLVRHGILQSTRGAGGGYALERSPAEISLLEVIEALDGPVVPTLPDHDGLPKELKAKLLRALTGVTGFARRELHSVKLAHLLPSGDGPSRSRK
jgi:Rrf2 family protein